MQCSLHLFGQARSLLAEDEETSLRQLHTLNRLRTGENIDSQHRNVNAFRPLGELGNRWVMTHVLVAVGDHRSPAVPAPLPDDVNFGGKECVGVAHHSPDVEVMLPVLNRNVE